MALIMIICSYGGELVSENNRYTYKGGYSKTTVVDVNTRYDELLSKMYKITKSRPKDYDIRLKALFPCINESVPPIVIEDDEDVRMLLAAQLKHSDQYIPLFIEIMECVNEAIPEHPLAFSGFEHDGPAVESLGEEHILKVEVKASPSHVPLSNTPVPEPVQTSNFTTSQVRASVDMNLISEYTTLPSFTRVDLASTSNAINVSGSDIPLPEQARTSDFTTGLPVVPFEDAGFTNADLSLYSHSLDDLIHIAEGQTFENKRRCKYVLSQFAIRNKFQYKVLYSTSKKFIVACMGDKCDWRVHTSRVNDAGIFKIKTYTSTHTCGMSYMKSDHRQASSKLASELVVNRIKQRLGLRPKDIILAMQEKYNILINYKKAWPAKEIAINPVMGSYEDSYKELPMYLHELRMANPETLTTLLADQRTGRFERCFVALGQCVRSFRTCLRRVLAIDGTHLKGKYKGVLFVATALDGDNHIFPIAFGIGESENSSSWNWFLMYLSHSLGDLPDLVIISDQHKGLMKEVPQVFQAAIFHGYCAYHIYRNLVDTFKDKSLEIYYWQAVKTCRRTDFEKRMHDIELANPPVHAWLREIGYEKWASSHFPGKRFNLVTKNITECVNALFKEAREYPVTMLIETIRLKIQKMFYKRRESASSFVGPLTPWPEKQLKDLIPKARDVRCHAISRDEYYIMGEYNDTVKLNELSCTCHEFEVLGLPCFHVLSICIHYNLPHYSYCSPLYTTMNYQMTYEDSVYPVRDKSQWEISLAFKELCASMKPSLQRRAAGRPKKARILSRGEERITKKCGRCKQMGHNRRSYKFPIHPE